MEHRTIGLIAGGFKPFSKGHFALVEKASAECDEVFLFISTKDRTREGELPITWEQMSKVWNKYLLNAMPSNVTVMPLAQPIGGILHALIEANDDKNNNNSYLIYSDAVDLKKNYPLRAQEKYFPRLMQNDQVIFKPISRGETDNISGTIMRSRLGKGFLKSFILGLPKPVRIYGPDIFKILGGKLR